MPSCACAQQPSGSDARPVGNGSLEVSDHVFNVVCVPRHHPFHHTLGLLLAELALQHVREEDRPKSHLLDDPHGQIFHAKPPECACSGPGHLLLLFREVLQIFLANKILCYVKETREPTAFVGLSHGAKRILCRIDEVGGVCVRRQGNGLRKDFLMPSLWFFIIISLESSSTRKPVCTKLF